MLCRQSFICPDALPSPSTQATFRLWTRASAELVSWHQSQHEAEGGLHFGRSLRDLRRFYMRCYPYALGDYNITLGRLMGSNPEPGILSGNPSPSTNPGSYDDFCHSLVNDLRMDGAVPTGNEIVIKEGFRPIAVFAGEFHAFSNVTGERSLEEDGTPIARFDFHFARLDDDGTWSDAFSGMSPEVLSFQGGGEDVVNPQDAWILPDLDSSVRHVIDARPYIEDPVYCDKPGVYRLVTIANIPAQIRLAGDAIERHLATMDETTAGLIRRSHRGLAVPKAGESISIQLG